MALPLPQKDTQTLPFIGKAAVPLDEEFTLRETFKLQPQQGCALLFRMYHAPLCNHAVRFVYSREAAEDIVAEVFCRFWQDKTYEQIQTSYRSYLFTAVRHKAFTYWKFELGRKSSLTLNDLEAPAPEPNPDEILVQNEMLHRIEQSISELPQQCKKVFLMSRMENKKYHEIAGELGISVKAIEGHISRALAVLRKKLLWIGWGLLTLFFDGWG
jgi:RNA polymerase sigma-70 factor (ECF subfamily)